VAVLPKYGAEVPLHVVSPPGRHIPHRVAIVRDFLASHLPGECRAHRG
jgi:hypothetical protein